MQLIRITLEYIDRKLKGWLNFFLIFICYLHLFNQKKVLVVHKHIWSEAQLWYQFEQQKEDIKHAFDVQLDFHHKYFDNIDNDSVLSHSFKPSAHSMIFVAGNRDLVFCRQWRKRISSIFDIDDRHQRQKPFICVSPHTASFRCQRQKCSYSVTKIVLCALGLRYSFSTFLVLKFMMVQLSWKIC